MFTGITWKDDFITVTLLLIAYCAAAMCWIYLDHLKVFFKSKSTIADQNIRGKSLFSQQTENLPNEDDKLIVLLKENSAHCFNKGYNREQFLKCIAKISCGYPSLEKISFREHIHRSIINECNKYSPVGLRNTELMGLWNTTTLVVNCFQNTMLVDDSQYISNSISVDGQTVP